MQSIVKITEYDYMARRRVIEELCEKYPFLRVGVIGHSCSGREIQTLRIGRGQEYVLLAGAFHGSEHITASLLLRFTEKLCAAIQSGSSLDGFDARKALQGRGIIIIPAVNPDGIEISLHGSSACGYMADKIGKLCKGDFAHWNANLRGVDLNHNFDAGWQALRELEKKNGIYGPCMTRFGGYYPLSEPETVALCELCRTLPIRHAAAFHSQGEVIYWNYGDNNPPRARKMAEIMATSSGYALDVPTDLAVGGGFKDWFIEEFCRPGFTVEIGKGQNPLPIEDLKGIEQRIGEMLMLLCVM